MDALQAITAGGLVIGFVMYLKSRKAAAFRKDMVCVAIPHPELFEEVRMAFMNAEVMFSDLSLLPSGNDPGKTPREIWVPTSELVRAMPILKAYRTERTDGAIVVLGRVSVTKKE